MRRIKMLLPAVGFALTGTVASHATVIQTHFNDMELGNLTGQVANDGGSGFAAGATWGNNNTPQVVEGNLTAPVSTNFSLSQAGTARMVGGNASSAERQTGADFETPLTDEVWGTFLVNTNSGGAAGIGFNSIQGFSTFNGRPKLLAVGNDLFFSDNLSSTNATEATAENVLPADGDSLILFRIVFNASGFAIDVWANPDLADTLPAPTLSSTSVQPDTLSLTRIGVGGQDGGLVDMVTLSDGLDGYKDVTGVPEPGAMALMGLGALAFCARRRRG